VYDVDEIVLAAAGVHVHVGALELLGSLVPGEGPVALVSDPHVGGIHGAAAQVALGARLVSVHEIPQGEAAKAAGVAERLWSELRLDRDGQIVALGGGSTTDVAGFVAATYLRGIGWVAVPTTIVGQVDAAIGGKTAIDLPEGKNLAGAFHWPARAVVDPATLETLPEDQRREGMAEVVKTGLLAGEPIWELPTPELVRRAAAFKAAVCLRDPHEHGERAILNLGHTFAHALEAAAGYEGLTHGRAVALGLLAALRLSGRATDVVEEVLAPERARVDRERAWSALQRDKKARGGELRLVLLREDGPVVEARPEAEVRSALDELIAE
jgi:3-dehydroquinate synthetase